jgi:hypothetical protein
MENAQLAMKDMHSTKMDFAQCPSQLALIHYVTSAELKLVEIVPQDSETP